MPLVNVDRPAILALPPSILAERGRGEGEIDKRNIEIAAMTNYIGSESRKGGGQEQAGARRLQLMHCAVT